MENTENTLVEPRKEDYGWESSNQETEGGWTIEGGEEAYWTAYTEYEEKLKGQVKDFDDIDDEVQGNCHGRVIPELEKQTFSEMLERDVIPLSGSISSYGKSYTTTTTQDIEKGADLEPDYYETTKADFESDNGVDPPLTEGEMEELSKQSEQVNEIIKFVIVGGNEPAVNKYFINSLNEVTFPIKVYELTMDEIKFIVNSRAEKQAETIAVDYLNDESYRRRVNEWVLILMQNHIKVNFPNITPDEARKYMDGEMELLFTKKTLKEASKLSWNDFEELMNSLKLFNFIKYDEENPNLFSLTVDEKEVVENQKSELRQILNIGNGVIFNLLKSKHISEDDVQNLEGIKATILEIIGKI